MAQTITPAVAARTPIDTNPFSIPSTAAAGAPPLDPLWSPGPIPYLVASAADMPFNCYWIGVMPNTFGLADVPLCPVLASSLWQSPFVWPQPRADVAAAEVRPNPTHGSYIGSENSLRAVAT
jgi:hypothetical protein